MRRVEGTTISGRHPIVLEFFMSKRRIKKKIAQARRYVYRPWRHHPKTGAILWARHYGLKAWKIPVDDDDNNNN
jgi:hypothetical protein